ncbi:MAG TPA: hypothetical protein VMN57_14710 [Anaerolineales bacterium]|nr:hypothetical protein [Anaerolineales bacterium]
MTSPDRQTPPNAPETTAVKDRPGVVRRTLVHPAVFQAQWAPAFWTITGTLSLAVNLVLLIVLVSLGRELFALKELLSSQLIGGLHANFVAMDAAVIETSILVEETITVEDVILVNDSIPVVFDLEISERTSVLLAEDTVISNAIVNLNTPSLAIFNAPTEILLPKDTILPTRLNLTVPVSQTVPVQLTVPVLLEVPISLTVPVRIPLDQTELHEPFVGLQNVVSPYQDLLQGLPGSWEAVACEAGRLLCWLFTR